MGVNGALCVFACLFVGWLVGWPIEGQVYNMCMHAHYWLRERHGHAALNWCNVGLTAEHLFCR